MIHTIEDGIFFIVMTAEKLLSMPQVLNVIDGLWLTMLLCIGVTAHEKWIARMDL